MSCDKTWMAGSSPAMTEQPMCLACEEMALYYAYLDAIEEEKRKAQPWQCEVTVIAPADSAASPAPPVAAGPSAASKPGFVCDEPE